MFVELIAYTKGVNGESPEEIIEKSARISYRSRERGEEVRKKFLRSLLKNGHMSVFEHASASFRVEGISRACSHQLVRHRLASFTQESQRYVNMGNFDFVTPEDIKQDPEIREEYENIIGILHNFYNLLVARGIKKEDARYILPNATATSLVVTANFREWLHIVGLRVSLEAQWEIRKLSTLFWRELYGISSTVFHVGSFSGYKDYDFKKEIFEKEITK